MDERVRAFLEQYHAAIMVTLKADGTPHVARVSLGLVNERLWSSGSRTRLRTRHLRGDPRATLCVLGDNPFSWLGLETSVTILDGPEAVGQNLALYRALRGEPEDVQTYRQAMVDEQRLIYEFTIKRAYGQY